MDFHAIYCLSAKVDLANNGDDRHVSDEDQTKPDLVNAWFV